MSWLNDDSCFNRVQGGAVLLEGHRFGKDRIEDDYILLGTDECIDGWSTGLSDGFLGLRSCTVFLSNDAGAQLVGKTSPASPAEVVTVFDSGAGFARYLLLCTSPK